MIVFSTLEEFNWYLEKQPIGTTSQITKVKAATTTVYEVGIVTPRVAKIVDQMMLTKTFTINELEEKIKEMKHNNFISLTISPNEPYKVDQLLKNLVLDNLLDELKINLTHNL